MKLKEIHQADLASASELLADAFYDNPAHIFICQEPQKRREQLNWLLGANLKIQLKNGAQSFCLKESNKINAMGFWTRPTINKVGLMKQIMGGLLRAPKKLGYEGFKRMMKVSKIIDNDLDKLLGNTPYWYLNNMVIDKKNRGKGLGTRILAHQMSEIRKNDSKAVFVLTTQKAANVGFYKRLNYKVIAEDKIKDGSDEFINWIMVNST